MNPWDGNQLWVFTSWKQPGGIERAVHDALQYGYNGLLVKAHDGNPADDTPEFRRQVDRALELGKPQGLTIGAWGYVYGPKFGDRQVDIEAQAIIDVLTWGVDWYVIDAEIEWEQPGGGDAVHRMMQPIRQAHPNAPIGYTPFWNTRYHAGYPYREFSQYCNVVLPQVYYVLGQRTTADRVQQMWNVTRQDFEALGLPVAPVGEFPGATEIQLQSFLTAIEGYPRSWWLWDGAPAELLQLAGRVPAQPAPPPGAPPLPTGLEPWQEQLGNHSLDLLQQRGLVSDPVAWRSQLGQPVPSWAVWAMLERVTRPQQPQGLNEFQP